MGGIASAAKNRSDKCPDRKYAELKAKLKEAQKLISEQNKLIGKQDRYIIRLTDKLAEKNKKSLYQQSIAVEKQKERARLLKIR